MTRLPTLPRALLAALLALSAPGFALAQGNNLNKTNGNGKWKDTGSWENDGGNTPDNVPGPSDRAIVNSGTLQISGDESVGELRLNGGDLTGYDESLESATVVPDSLSLLGGSFDSEWTDGIISELTLVIASGSVLDINHSAAGTLSNAVLDVQFGGTVNWLSGDLLLNSNSTINNAGEWFATDDARVRHAVGTGGVFNNLGDGIYRQQGAGTSAFDDTFNNDGALYVDSGTLEIGGGGTMSSSGTVNVATGATLVFTDSYTVADAGGFSGSGLYRLTGGTLTLDGIALVGMQMDGGILTGDNTFAGGFQWNNGDFVGGTTLNDLGASFEINDAAGNTFNGHAFTNQGTVYWNDGDILLNNGAEITNHGTFEDAATESGQTHNVRTAAGTGARFTNSSSADYTASGGGTTDFQIPFDNQGNVTLTDDSTLVLGGTGTNSGGAPIFANAGTSLVFDDDYTVQDAHDLQGDGQFTLASGTLTMGGEVNALEFTINGGTLLGSNTFNRGLIWNNGILGANGITYIAANSSLEVNDAAGNTLNGHTLINDGTATWNDGDLLLNNTSTITNGSAGTWTDAATDSGETHNVRTAAGTGAYFTNQGTYTKTGAGSTEFDIDFYNDGDVEVQAGKLILDGGGNASGAATFTVSSGAALSFDADYSISDAANLLGSGQVALDNGTLTLDGEVSVPEFAFNGGILTGTHTFLNGADWNNGILQNGQTYNRPDSVFTINDAGGNTLNSHLLDSSGTIDWTDGDILLNNGSWISNQSVFNDSAAASGESHSIRSASGSGAQFVNYTNSTYNKTGEGTTVIDVEFFNDDTLNVYSGVLKLSGGGTTYGSATLFTDAGAELVFDDDYEVSDAAVLTGTGQVTLASGTLTLNGTVGVPGFAISGGTLAGTVTFANDASWNNGTIASTSLTNEVESVFSINDPSGNILDATFFINDGQVNWTDGDILLNNGSSISNSGLWQDTATGAGENHSLRTSAGTGAAFYNSGTYEKASDGTTVIDVYFDNGGTLDVDSGVLKLDGGGSTSTGGSFDVASNATLIFSHDYQVYDAAFPGSGQVKLEGGELSLNGTVDAPDFIINGGNLTGTHTFTADATLTNGALGSYGTTTNAAGSTFTFADTGGNLLNAHTFENYGIAAWTAGDLLLSDGSSFNNYNTFSEQTNADQRIRTSFGSPGLFYNETGALFKKEGTGITDVDVTFTNFGDIHVLDGALRLNDGGYLDSFATIDVDADTYVRYAGSFTVSDAAGLTGAGSHIASGSDFHLDGTFDGNLVLAAGTLDGTHGISGTLRINNGAVTAGGSTTINPAGKLLLHDSGGNTFEGRTVDNQGYAGLFAGDLHLNDGSTFTNDGSLELDADLTGGDFRIETTSGGMGLLQNPLGGTVTQLGTGTTTILLPFDSNGEVRLDAGRIILVGGGFADSTAVFDAAPETELIFNSNYTLTDLASLQGAGTYRLQSGTLDAPGTLGSELIVDGGLLHGDVTVDGTLEFGADAFEYGHSLDIAAGGTLIVDSATGFTMDGANLTVDSGGTFDWLGGDLRLETDASLINEGDLNFDGIFANLDAGTRGSVAGLAGGDLEVSAIGLGSHFANYGTFTLGPDSGSLLLNLPFTHAGTLELQGGQLSLTQDSTLDSTSSVILGADTEFRVDSGTTTVTDAAIFSGDGALVQLGGQLNLDGDLDVDLHLIDGHLNTTALTVSRSFRLDDATLSSGASINLVNGATGEFDPVSLDLGTTLISVDADSFLAWQGGDLYADTGGGFDIAGLMTAETDHTFGPSSSTGGSFTLQKTGQFRKVAGPGTTTFDVPVFVEGRFEVHTGAVDFNAPGSSTGGTFDLWSGTTLSVNNDFTFGDGTDVSNGGDLVINGGDITFDGHVTLGPRATLAAGTYLGTHTLDGFITWSGGDFDPAGTTTIGENGMLQLTTDQTYQFGRDFAVDGQVVLANGDINGTAATFTNNGNLLILTDGLIGSVTDDFSIQNNGVIGKVAGSGTATVDVPVTNAGAVFSGSGILHFADSFTFAGGTIGVSNGGKVTFAAPLTLPKAATLAGNGTITADISTGGTISPGASVGSLTIDGDLTLLTGATSFFEIDEVSTGILGADLLTVSGTLTLAGDLQLDFLTSLDPIATDMFTLYTANTLLGTFENVANGGQIWADLPDGGRGIFTVNYGGSSLFDPNSVILSDFEFSPIPEPSTWALMITGLGLIALQFHRRRRSR